MRIVVIGASGRIGEKLVRELRRADQSVVEASPTFGVDAVTGQGLEQALDQAQVVVDVSNSPRLTGEAPLRFFDAAGRRLAAAAGAAGVQHHIALSIVGTDRLLASPYFQAKKRQEDLIEGAGLPYSILRSTQFFEFIAGVVQDGSSGDVVVPPVQVQPLSVVDVVAALADLATGAPLNDTVELAGPDQFRLPDLTADVLTAYEDRRRIIEDPCEPYFGAILEPASLLPTVGARIAPLRFEDWLRESLQPDAAPFPARRLGVLS